MSKSYIELLNEEYIKLNLVEQERDLLIQEKNVQTRDVKGYHGRELLELLQNADDAYKVHLETTKTDKNKNVSVLIEYKGNILTVSNTGTTFDNDGIKSIVQGNNSPKGSSLIGNKGTGFRSVLNWVNKVQIFSGNFNLEFSEEFALEEFQKIKKSTQIKKQLLKEKNLFIPMLSIGKDIEPIEKQYDTVIKLFIKPITQNDDFSIEKQINNIDENLLLFLPCIDEIIIKTEKSNITYKRNITINDFKSIKIEKKEYNKISKEFIVDRESNYYLFEKRIKSFINETDSDDVLKDVELAIAIPQDFYNFDNRLIYSYFPIQSFRSPFNCIMHATFTLDDQRNNIVGSETNKMIYKELLKFLTEVSKKFLNDVNRQRSLSIVTPNIVPTNFYYGPKFKLFEYTDSKLKFLNEVLNEFVMSLAKEEIFPNVVGEFISFSNGIKIIEDKIPKEFNRKEFDNLLEPIISKSSNYLIKKIADNLGYNINYNETELLNIVNTFSDELDVNEQINIFLYWNKNFKTTLPNLIKTQNNEYISFKQDCYFLVGDVSSGLPSWVKVPAIHKDYQSTLLQVSESIEKIIELKRGDPTNHITRIISQNDVYPLVKFNYRDKSNIITTINSSVDSYNKSIDFLKWIWKHYKKEEDSWSPPLGTPNSPVNYQFPSNDENIITSKKIFFGKLHGYPLNNQLFTSYYKELIEFSKLEIDKDDYKEAVILFSKFGVMLNPKIELKEIGRTVLPAYKEMIHEDVINGKIFEIGKSHNIQFRKWEINQIDNLESILLNNSYVDIIKWISYDVNLQNELMIDRYYNRQDIYIECKGNLQGSFRKYTNVPNYILFIFNNTKWIKINEFKYSPTEILNGFNNWQNIKFKEQVPVITQEIVKDISNKIKIDIDDVLNILKIFDFCNHPTDLASNDFYKLMLVLPKIDINKAIELSQIIYRRLESSEFKKTFKNSKNKETFLKSGEVLVNYLNEMKFVPNYEAYCPSIKIIDKKGTKIVVKGQRTSNKSFIDLLGCKKYEDNYEVVHYVTSENYNSYFQDEFNNFIYFAKAYSEHNENVKKEIDKLEIEIVSEVKVNESNKIKEDYEDYTVLRKKSKWFITLKGDYDNNKLSECIENIFSNIADSPGFNSSAIGELFRQKSIKDREFLITKEFGSLNVLYKQESAPIKESFISAIAKINPNFNTKLLENIRLENINSEENFLKIKEILLKLNIDIVELENKGFDYKINARKHNIVLTEKTAYENRNKYKNWLYKESLNNEIMQQNFVKKYEEFANYGPQDVENSIYYDPILHLIAKFGNFTEEVNVDCEEIYSMNYNNLNPKGLFEDEIQNDNKAKQYIYFSNVEKFNSWLTNKQKQKAEVISFVERHKSFENIIPKNSSQDFKKPYYKPLKVTRSTSRVVTEVSLINKEKNKIEKGNIAELLIYNLLTKQYGKKNVIPKSEAFVKLKILKPGQASSGDYDISYIDADGVEIFVEVKSSDGEQFYITPNELNFAKNNPDKYKVFLVFVDNENPGNSRYKELPYRFWEDEKFLLKEIVEKIHCIYKL